MVRIMYAMLPPGLHAIVAEDSDGYAVVLNKRDPRTLQEAVCAVECEFIEQEMTHATRWVCRSQIQS
jgi:hypothetical protein